MGEGRCVMILLLAGCGDNLHPGADDEARCALPGTWTNIGSPAVSPRVDHTAVWTGTEMIVWGGTQNVYNPFSDGAAFDPITGAWTVIHAPILPRDDHAAVWTGSEMLVWGGNSYDEDYDKLNDGGGYRPGSGWYALPPVGLSPRDDPRAVWTGTEMIVWGGHDDFQETDDGARYHPPTRTWRSVSRTGAPEPREDHTAVWTGTEMIVWGGWNGISGARNYDLHGGRYDPVTDTWRTMSVVDQPALREDHTAIWTGTEMIVWGGVVKEGTRHRVATGGAYDPVADRWRAISVIDAPSAREDDVVVWTGREMLVWGGRGDSALAFDAARYSPSLDRWCPIATENAPPVTHDAAGIWTGTELVVWGGDSIVGMGAVYSPYGGAYTPPP